MGVRSAIWQQREHRQVHRRLARFSGDCTIGALTIERGSTAHV
jgi:hypothetical protein